MGYAPRVSNHCFTASYATGCADFPVVPFQTVFVDRLRTEREAIRDPQQVGVVNFHAARSESRGRRFPWRYNHTQNTTMKGTHWIRILRGGNQVGHGIARLIGGHVKIYAFRKETSIFHSFIEAFRFICRSTYLHP